ncbi:hypothetical protein [Hymenobacter cellulosivorans]|nr:hypothetical protein [Hymenobacter cellulosivorans]
MKIPGLKMRPQRDGSPDDNYSKWGWYAMAVLSIAWIIYNLMDGK